MADAIAVPLSSERVRLVDDDLVARARRGDATAVDALARAHLRFVDRMLYRILGVRADRDDLIQNVFLEMCRALPTFRSQSSFTTFLGGIVTIVARRAMRPTAFDRHRAALSDEPLAPGGDPESATLDRLRIARLHAALASLSDDHRIAFSLWALEGVDPPTIAEMTGASLSATRSRIYYAQKHLLAAARSDALLAEWLGGDDDDAG